MKFLIKSLALLLVVLCVMIGSGSVLANTNQVIVAQNTQLSTRSGGNETPFVPKHNYVSTVTMPTCTENGYTTQVIVAQNTQLSTRSGGNETPFVPKHNYVSTVTMPTCTENGYTTYYCAHCGDSYVTDYIGALGHDFDNGIIIKEATCAESGIKTFTCKRDPNHTYSEIIPKAEHTPDEAVMEDGVSATCCAVGSYDEVVYCSVCGIEISREHKTVPIDADAHDFGEWVQTKAPTETESGEETRTCKHDSQHTETREIPALGPSQIELSFLDDEVIIVVPTGAAPSGSNFDVQKIVPPPAEIVEKVKDQICDSSEVLAYYEIRLFEADGTSLIIHLDGEIIIKIKMPEQYVGSKCVRILQEDETGKLIVMESWWENDYLCYKTDWLEIYN